MKKLVLVLSAVTVLVGNGALAQTSTSSSTTTTTTTTAGTTAQAPAVLDVPEHKCRRRMLVDFGLFGCGIHVGWMKPKSYVDANVSDRRIGKPIFNVSAGTHALGVGKD